MSLIINVSDKKLEKIKTRGAIFEEEYLKTAADIVGRVRKEGDKALFEYTEKFDKFNISKDNIKVSEKEYDEALKSTPKNVLESIYAAKENILSFHKLQMEKTWMIEREGALLGQKITPISRAGVYVPGGKASYFSSAMMNILPAVAAGVKEIYMASPATGGGLNHATVAAAKICGVTDIYKIGGAQAIAALAYGTDSVPKVDKVTGPGNIYVALAKKLVFGAVDIDMIAGPSEILIIADETANPAWIAADMLAQCEHDELASAICLTWDKELAVKIESEVYKQLDALPKKHIAGKSLENYSAIVITQDIDEACAIANSIAPEHLELYVNAPMEHMMKIEHAGAIFLGGYTPEALGDYFAGPNHVLPTGGSARFFSPLGAYDFFKRTSIIRYDKKTLERDAQKVINMAEAENLDAHAKSIKIRFGR